MIKVNQSFEKLFNLTRKNIIGKSGKEIFTDFDDEILNKLFLVAINGKSISFKFYSTFLKKYFNVIAFSPNKYFFGVLFEDITDSTEKERKFEELLNFQSTIRKINSLVNSCKNKKEFIKKVCDEINKLNGVIFVYIELKGEIDKIKLASLSGVSQKYLKGKKVRINKSKLINFGPAEQAIKENKNIIINNIDLDKDFYPWSRMVLSYGVKSIASFPINNEDEVVGSLNVYSNKKGFFNEDIINLLTEISGDICMGIRKFIDKEKIMDKTKELEKTIDNMLSSFSKIISLKEPYTGNHSLRVSNLALLIGKEMRLSEDRLIALKYASFLHDLGKIFIPSEILNKYGKLTFHEFNLVKEHVLKSFEIIKDINFPYPTHEIILQHHERVDGSGYPNGLKSDEILLEAKILAVADVVDAMLNDRPYRTKLNLKDVIDELNNNKEVKYDKEVVEATLKVLKSLNQSESENSN